MDTINGVATILFDTGVLVVTVQNTIETIRLQRGVKIWQKKSLTGVFINQGEDFFFWWWINSSLNHNKVLSDMGTRFITLTIFHLSNCPTGLCLQLLLLIPFSPRYYHFHNIPCLLKFPGLFQVLRVSNSIIIFTFGSTQVIRQALPQFWVLCKTGSSLHQIVIFTWSRWKHIQSFNNYYLPVPPHSPGTTSPP